MNGDNYRNESPTSPDGEEETKSHSSTPSEASKSQGIAPYQAADADKASVSATSSKAAGSTAAQSAKTEIGRAHV